MSKKVLVISSSLRSIVTITALISKGITDSSLKYHLSTARTNGGGQLLICVDGEGWYQEEGKPAQSLSVGDVVTIPANVKHWHGAKADSWFSHIAVEVPGEDCRNEWCEPVSDTEYNALQAVRYSQATVHSDNTQTTASEERGL